MNKKGNFGLSLYGFMFVLIVVSVVMLFVSFGFHFITYDYVIEPTANIGQSLLNSSGTAYANIENLKDDYYGRWAVYDLLFFATIISLFIQSCWTAIRAKRLGFMTFMGLLTIGNLFFVLLLSYAINIRTWILNEFFYKIITESFTARLTFMFFENSYYICFGWFTILLVLSYVDIPAILEKVGFGGENEGEVQE